MTDTEPLPPEQAPRRFRLRWLLAALLTLGALAGAWFGLPIRSVTVEGNRQLTEQRVRELAGLSPNFGWLFYGAWRAQGLKRSPWVEKAVITRTFPDKVDIRVTERLPFAYWKRPKHSVALAVDGTYLPGATPQANWPVIQGWGPSRTDEAVLILRALEGYNVKVVEYTPSSFLIKTKDTQLWASDVQHILKYASAVSEYSGKMIHIYPWGVSAK